MGLFLSPESNANQTTTTVDNGAQLNKAGSTVANGNGIAVSRNGILSTGPVIRGKLSVGRNGQLTINYGDGGQGAALNLAAIKDIVGQANAQTSQALEALAGSAQASADSSGTIAEQVSSALQNAFDKLSSLTESNNTGGQSSANKQIVWLVIGCGALAVIGIAVAKKKKLL